MELRNKHVNRDYQVRERLEAGIELTGPEVKSCKAGNASFKGAYCSFIDPGSPEGKEIHSQKFFLRNFYIAPYALAKREQRNYNPYRDRLLLLHKKQLHFLYNTSGQVRSTIIPLRMYTKNRLVKLEIALCIGLKKYDRREKVKREEFKRRELRLVQT